MRDSYVPVDPARKTMATPAATGFPQPCGRRSFPTQAFHAYTFKEWDLVDVGERSEEPQNADEVASEKVGDVAKEVAEEPKEVVDAAKDCLLYTSPSPRDKRQSRMPSSA